MIRFQPIGIATVESSTLSAGIIASSARRHEKKVKRVEKDRMKSVTF